MRLDNWLIELFFFALLTATVLDKSIFHKLCWNLLDWPQVLVPDFIFSFWTQINPCCLCGFTVRFLQLRDSTSNGSACAGHGSTCRHCALRTFLLRWRWWMITCGLLLRHNVQTSRTLRFAHLYGLHWIKLGPFYGALNSDVGDWSGSYLSVRLSFVLERPCIWVEFIINNQVRAVF